MANAHAWREPWSIRLMRRAGRSTRRVRPLLFFAPMPLYMRLSDALHQPCARPVRQQPAPAP